MHLSTEALEDLNRIAAATGRRGATATDILVAFANGKGQALLSAMKESLKSNDIPNASTIGQLLSRAATQGAPVQHSRDRRTRATLWSVAAPVPDATNVHRAQAVGDSHEPRNPDRVVPLNAAEALFEAVAPGAYKRVEPSGDSGELDPRKDPSLHSPLAPKGYHLRGVSTLLDGDGNVSQRWVKTVQDREQQRMDALLDAIKSLPDSFRDAHVPFKAPESVSDDMLVVYPIGDPHLAMLAWAEETGANYDLKIAERLHVQAIKHLVNVSPAAKHALVVSLGDYFHVSNDLARTERSGNPLDTDSRFSKALRVGMRMFRAMIDAALAKHERVTVICEIGNHDAQASVALALALDAFYARDERVNIDVSPSKFHYYRFGKCLFGTTHGDGAKPDKLPMVMAQDRAREWGETRFRKWFVGHIHQQRVMSFPGCVVEHYRTLAANDAWSHGEGYRSDRGMCAEYYHREHGFVGSSYVGLNQLEAA